MKPKFLFSLGLAGLWLGLSLLLAGGWARHLTRFWPAWYVWWVILGIALLPGFLMSGMFFSNWMHRRWRPCPPAGEDTTVLICARNEEATIARALNAGLAQVRTAHFLTVDADTFLERQAVGRILAHITARGSACVAGNLFAANPGAGLAAGMQNYDYLLSIAAVKRFQGSYGSTLVAQGAFSAYETEAVRQAGGWPDRLGEDIVLTYRLLRRGRTSSYEPGAVGYTTVPPTLAGLYSQRRRWVVGMLEGLGEVPPWRQGSAFSRYFEWVNLSVVWLDLAFLFGFVPGGLLALMGYWYLVGFLTLFTAAVGGMFFLSTWQYQRRLGIPFGRSPAGFVLFLLFFQLIQSAASLQGHLSWLLGRKGGWK